MIEALRRRLTLANTLAVIAIFISLGGTVYAAGVLSGTQIRPGSLPANRLKPNSVTGKQVKESSLKAVPFAKEATSLTGAGWGKVSASGVLSDGHNVASISHSTGQGLYCIRITRNNPAQSPMQVTLDGSDDDTAYGTKVILATAEWFSAGHDCPEGGYEVRTADFQVEFGKLNSQFADNAFSFFVP
jgi:hypothetical protein